MSKHSLIVAALLGSFAVPALAQDEAANENNGLFGTSFLEGWERRFTLGIDGQEDEGSEFNLYTLLELDYADERDRWSIDASYDFGKEDGGNTDNEIFVKVLKDWLMPEEDYFFWAYGDYEYDQFESYDQRATGFGGVGYKILETEKHEIDGRLGAGLVKEWKPNDFRPEAVAGIDYKWDINDNQDLEASNYIFPSLDNLGNFRNVTNIDWVISMDAAEGLSLRIGVENEYDTNVSGDAKRNDFQYRIALVIDF